MIRVANAPCSWGALEFDAAQLPAPAPQVLDEMAAAGYAGTELGDWGFLPTAPEDLAATVERATCASSPPSSRWRSRVPTRSTKASLEPSARAAASERAGRRCLVLSDDNGGVASRTLRAGRIRDDEGLTDDQWTAFAQRAERVAAEVRRAAGLRTVFHHHCAGYVETPREIDALCSRTDPTLLGLCLDTGHLTFAGGDPLAALAAWGDRIWHVHFKDCDPDLAKQSRSEGWDYHESVRRGIFCELGRGAVPFARVLDALRARGYNGWIVVEQDVLPGLGTPAASAMRNREYLRGLGI